MLKNQVPTLINEIGVSAVSESKTKELWMETATNKVMRSLIGDSWETVGVHNRTMSCGWNYDKNYDNNNNSNDNDNGDNNDNDDDNDDDGVETVGIRTFADKLYKECLDGNMFMLPMTARTDLARFYELTGKYHEASVINKLLLDHEIKVLGLHNTDVLDTMFDVASFHERHDKYAEAEELFNRCLRLRKSVLRKNSPQVLTTMESLASTYDSQGKMLKPRLFEQSLS